MRDWLRALNKLRLKRRRERRARSSYELLLAHEAAELTALRGQWPARAAAMGDVPLITLLWLPAQGDRAQASALWQALTAQAWQHFELLTDTDRALAPAGADARWQVSPGAKNPSLQQRYNRLLAGAQGDYVLLLRDGDLPAAPHGLLLLAEAAVQCARPPLLVADEDMETAGGRRHSPLFKCGWNQELQRSTHSLGRAWLVRTDVARAAGGLDAQLPLATAEQLLALQAADQRPGQAAACVPHVLLHRRSGLNPSVPVPAAGTIDQAAAVQAYLLRRGTPATVKPAPRAGLHVRYACPTPLPLVSLIVPTRNGLALLRQCVDSVLQKTTYPNYELLIVDNGSDDPQTLAWMAQTCATDARVRVHRDDRPFNYAQLNNDAVPHCRGTVLALLNNDTEVISPDWLDEMVGLACRPDVGAVGARLWFGNQTLQHAGVLIGLGGHAGHVHMGLTAQEPGYAGRAWLPQEFSAVTAACLVLRREAFLSVGGLDAQQLAVDLNDIDLCLKLRSAGLRVVWTPFAELFHHESASRGKVLTPEKQARLQAERACFAARWAPWLTGDPAYHPALSLRHGAYTPTASPRVSLGTPWWQQPASRLSALECPPAERVTT